MEVEEVTVSATTRDREGTLTADPTGNAVTMEATEENQTATPLCPRLGCAIFSFSEGIVEILLRVISPMVRMANNVA